MFFLLPVELKQGGGRDAIPTANAAIIAVNVVLFSVGWQWPVGPGAGVLSLVLYGFSHLGFWHLAANMWILWIFGNPVNRRLGNGYYLLAYLGMLLALGVLARVVLTGSMLGASGAIFGVVTICAILMPAARLKIAYLAAFPLTLLIGLVKLPEHWLYWFLRWGNFSLCAAWSLVLIPLHELVFFFWSGWNLAYLAHLLGMLCGVAVVLMLPEAITIRRRRPAAAGF